MIEVTPAEAINMMEIAVRNRDEQNWRAIEKMFRENYPKANYFQVLKKVEARNELLRK